MAREYRRARNLPAEGTLAALAACCGGCRPVVVALAAVGGGEVPISEQCFDRSASSKSRQMFLKFATFVSQNCRKTSGKSKVGLNVTRSEHNTMNIACSD